MIYLFTDIRQALIISLFINGEIGYGWQGLGALKAILIQAYIHIYVILMIYLFTDIRQALIISLFIRVSSSVFQFLVSKTM